MTILAKALPRHPDNLCSQIFEVPVWGNPSNILNQNKGFPALICYDESTFLSWARQEESHMKVHPRADKHEAGSRSWPGLLGKRKCKQDMMTHTCHPSSLGDWDGRTLELRISRSAGTGRQNPFSKTQKKCKLKPQALLRVLAFL